MKPAKLFFHVDNVKAMAHAYNKCTQLLPSRVLRDRIGFAGLVADEMFGPGKGNTRTLGLTAHKVAIVFSRSDVFPCHRLEFFSRRNPY